MGLIQHSVRQDPQLPACLLRRFLLEEAAETFAAPAGAAARILCAGGAETAGAAKLRLHHACRESADIGKKFRIRGRALDLERHGCAALATTATAATCYFAKHSARAGYRASNVTERAIERGGHFEIEIVLGVDCARAGKISDIRQNGDEIVRLQTVGRHAKIAGHLFNLQVSAALDARKRSNTAHL